MPRYKLVIEYDGAPFRGGSASPKALGSARGRGRGERFAGEARGSLRRAPQPASTPPIRWPISTSPKSGAPTPSGTPSKPHCAALPVAILSAEIVPDGFGARIPRGNSIILPHPEPARPAGARPRNMCDTALGARRRWDAGGGRDLLGRRDFTPSAPADSRRTARADPGAARRDAGRRRDPRRGGGALPSCTTRCARSSARFILPEPGAGPPRKCGNSSRHATTPAAGRWRRRRASITHWHRLFDGSGHKHLSAAEMEKIKDEPEHDDRNPQSHREIPERQHPVANHCSRTDRRAEADRRTAPRDFESPTRATARVAHRKHISPTTLIQLVTIRTARSGAAIRSRRRSRPSRPATPGKGDMRQRDEGKEPLSSTSERPGSAQASGRRSSARVTTKAGSVRTMAPKDARTRPR